LLQSESEVVPASVSTSDQPPPISLPNLSAMRAESPEMMLAYGKSLRRTAGPLINVENGTLVGGRRHFEVVSVCSWARQIRAQMPTHANAGNSQVRVVSFPLALADPTRDFTCARSVVRVQAAAIRFAGQSPLRRATSRVNSFSRPSSHTTAVSAPALMRSRTSRTHRLPPDEPTVMYV